MLNQIKHKAVLLEILKDIYDDPDLRTILGFKGGTAAMLFYDLPRISVDLDFNLLEEDKKEMVLRKMKVILERHGQVREAIEKRYTLFFLISYESGKRTVKVEVSKRVATSEFESRNYLGVTALVMKEGDMAAGKLAALLTRKKLATRDVFDLWFFLKNKWPINGTVLTEQTGLTLRQALRQAIKVVNDIPTTQLLRGLAELVEAKQKDWVRTKLKADTVFYLRLYREMLAKGV